MTEMFEQFHFVRPLWLIALAPALVLFFWFWRQQYRSSQWNTLINKQWLPFLLESSVAKKRRYPLAVLLALWFVAIFSAAGPTWEKQAVPLKKVVSSLVILWDLSPSMNARDVKPNRVVRSRLKLIDMLNSRKDGLTGLIAYSGESHVVTPLTDDSETIINLLAGLSPEVMPAKGSNTEMAFDDAIELLQGANVDSGDILILTDGIAADAIDDLATVAKQHNHRVTVWGIGTEDGAPIPLSNGGFARNKNSEIIIAKRDNDKLSRAAVEMGGIYIPFSNDDLDIQSILGFGLIMNESASIETEHERLQWLERGPYLVLLLLPFAAFAFRRGWLLSITALFFVVQPQESHALSWQDLWQTKDQQAAQMMLDGDAEGAAQTFKNERWKAIAQYNSGDYESSLSEFSSGSDALSFYNHGNALTQLGQYQQAIDAYNSALSIEPDFTEAKDNLRIAEQLKQLHDLAQQNQDTSQDPQDGEQQSGEDGENSESGENGESGQSGEPGENGESGENSKQGDTNSEQNGEPQEGSNSENTDDNKGEQGESGEGESSEQGEGEEDSLGEQEKGLSEADKKALENQYGEQQENKDENNKDAADSAPEQQQAAAGQEQGLNQNQDPNQESNEEGEDGDRQGQQLPKQMISDKVALEEKEQQQSLEQWLRRVPDNPKALLEEKFRHENRERRRELRSNTLRLPPGEDKEERW